MGKLEDRKIYFVFTWFSLSIICLCASLIFWIYISQTKVLIPKSQNFRLYSALPESTLTATESIVSEDARAVIIRNFFKQHKAPLQNQADAFIKNADKYQLDYRLLPSIAMQESNGGKRIIEDSFNPFGYGIYGDKVKRFTSFEEAIERVARALREDYLDQGLTTPNSIMTKYTPPSLATGGTWAKGVLSFMEELQ